jgi:AcrR family transcriptional regulator
MTSSDLIAARPPETRSATPKIAPPTTTPPVRTTPPRPTLTPANPPPTLRDEFRLQVRDRALDTAASALLEEGWPQVRLAELARRAGISRATLHRLFGGKSGLANALVGREVDRVLAEVARALDQGPTWDTGLLEALRIAVRAREQHPVIDAVLESPHGDPGLLPLLTTRSAPMISQARRLLVRFLHQHHPGLTATYLGDVADTLVRATLSHLVAPAPDELAAERLHRVARHLVRTPPVVGTPRARAWR